MWPFTSWNAKQSLAVTVARKRDARAAAIQEGLNLAGNDTDGRDAAILAPKAYELVKQLQDGDLSCLRVMQAYVRLAARAHKATNCLTEPMFVEALRRASELDDWKRSASEEDIQAKPMFGLPISLKDQLHVEGYDSTLGFARYCDQPASSDGTLTTILRDAGAIPFCKTNVPQTMLAFECSNPLFGRTTNPYSGDHVPGGSSGGEGALLALSGSALGIGSDIGGSLRIPAHYSGCYSLKPVYGRFPSSGAASTVPGFEAIRTTFGPMARSIQDLELCTKAVINAAIIKRLHRTEANLLPLPYRDTKLPDRLRIGYFTEDGFIPTSPACGRALSTAIQAMKDAGHTCIPIHMPEPTAAFEIFQALSSSDGYNTLTSHLLPKEPREPALFLVTLGPRVPAFLRSAVSWLLRTVAGEHIMSKLVSVSREKRTSEVWQWQHRRNEYVAKARKHLWGDLGLDAVICPVQAVPAVTHGATKRLSPLAIQTIIWNVVDSTVGVIPVLTVDSKIDALPANFDEKIKAAGTPLLSKLCYSEVYNAKAMHGLPVGVQIVGPAWEEERIIGTMKLVDSALEKLRGGPLSFPNPVQEKVY